MYVWTTRGSSRVSNAPVDTDISARGDTMIKGPTACNGFYSGLKYPQNMYISEQHHWWMYMACHRGCFRLSWYIGQVIPKVIYFQYLIHIFYIKVNTSVFLWILRHWCRRNCTNLDQMWFCSWSLVGALCGAPALKTKRIRGAWAFCKTSRLWAWYCQAPRKRCCRWRSDWIAVWDLWKILCPGVREGSLSHGWAPWRPVVRQGADSCLGGQCGITHGTFSAPADPRSRHQDLSGWMSSNA